MPTRTQRLRAGTTSRSSSSATPCSVSSSPTSSTAVTRTGRRASRRGAEPGPAGGRARPARAAAARARRGEDGGTPQGGSLGRRLRGPRGRPLPRRGLRGGAPLRRRRVRARPRSGGARRRRQDRAPGAPAGRGARATGVPRGGGGGPEPPPALPHRVPARRRVGDHRRGVIEEGGAAGRGPARPRPPSAPSEALTLNPLDPAPTQAHLAVIEDGGLAGGHSPLPLLQHHLLTPLP